MMVIKKNEEVGRFTMYIGVGAEISELIDNMMQGPSNGCNTLDIEDLLLDYLNPVRMYGLKITYIDENTGEVFEEGQYPATIVYSDDLCWYLVEYADQISQQPKRRLYYAVEEQMYDDVYDTYKMFYEDRKYIRYMYEDCGYYSRGEDYELAMDAIIHERDKGIDDAILRYKHLPAAKVGSIIIKAAQDARVGKRGY